MRPTSRPWIAPDISHCLDPVLGDKMQKIVEKVLATPKDVAAKAKGLME